MFAIKYYIRGNPERPDKVLKEFGALGVPNPLGYECTEPDVLYYEDPCGVIYAAGPDDQLYHLLVAFAEEISC